MRADFEAWAAAGGDAERAELYATIGAVALFVDADGGRCLAAVHPDRELHALERGPPDLRWSVLPENTQGLGGIPLRLPYS